MSRGDLQEMETSKLLVNTCKNSSPKHVDNITPGQKQLYEDLGGPTLKTKPMTQLALRALRSDCFGHS